MNFHADNDLDALMQGYLDGELDSAAEQRLFTALSSDSGLQRELRELRAIRAATVGGVRSFIPPAALTGALFARLGMPAPAQAADTSTVADASGAATPGATATPGAAGHATAPASVPGLTSGTLPHAAASVGSAGGSVMARIVALLQAARLPLALITTGAVLTTTVLLWKDSDRVDTPSKDAPVADSRSIDTPTPADNRPLEGKPSSAPSATTPSATTPSATTPSATTPSATTPSATAPAVKAPASNVPTATSHAAKLPPAPVPTAAVPTAAVPTAAMPTAAVPTAAAPNAAVPPARSQETGVLPEPGLPPASSEWRKPRAEDVAALHAMNLPAFAVTAPAMDTATYVQPGMQPRVAALRLPRGFTLSFSGLAKSSAPSVDLPTASDPLFNRMSVALGYEFDASSHIGITVGQEAFPQIFTGTEARHGVRYEQNLLTPWAAAWYRHTFGALLFEDLHPWAELGAGSTREFWPLVRGGAGLAYDLHPLLRLQAGVDLGVLGYQFQQRWFTTRHIGLSYGLMLRF